MPEPIIRRGELSEQSLVDALLAERAQGRRPTQLAVGSAALEHVALNVLDTHGPLDELRAGVPNVVLDPGLHPDGWELRAA